MTSGCVIVAIVIVGINVDFEDQKQEQEEEEKVMSITEYINIYENMLIMKLRSDLYYDKSNKSNKFNKFNKSDKISFTQHLISSSPIPIYKK